MHTEELKQIADCEVVKQFMSRFEKKNISGNTE